MLNSQISTGIFHFFPVSVVHQSSLFPVSNQSVEQFYLFFFSFPPLHLICSFISYALLLSFKQKLHCGCLLVPSLCGSRAYGDVNSTHYVVLPKGDCCTLQNKNREKGCFLVKQVQVASGTFVAVDAYGPDSTGSLFDQLPPSSCGERTNVVNIAYDTQYHGLGKEWLLIG